MTSLPWLAAKVLTDLRSLVSSFGERRLKGLPLGLLTQLSIRSLECLIDLVGNLIEGILGILDVLVGIEEVLLLRCLTVLRTEVLLSLLNPFGDSLPFSFRSLCQTFGGFPGFLEELLSLLGTGPRLTF